MSTLAWKEAHPEKVRQYRRDWYYRNRDAAKAKVKARNRELACQLRELKGSLSCQLCGTSDPAVLDFHHRDPSTKEITIANAARLGWGKQRLMEEIAKCDVLCANCHRKTHYSYEKCA